MSIDTLSNCHYDSLKEARNIKVQKPIKPFDPFRVYAKQCELKKSPSIMEHTNSIIKEVHAKSEDIIEERCSSEIKKLEEEIREIDKKLDLKEFGSKIKDEEKKQLEERKKAIGDEIGVLKKGKKAETEKIFGQILALYKTFETIKEASGLADKQFKQTLVVAGTEWAYSTNGKIGQSFQEVIKTLFKLILENKL